MYFITLDLMPAAPKIPRVTNFHFSFFNEDEPSHNQILTFYGGCTSKWISSSKVHTS